MAFYSYFAYFVMLTALFFTLRYCFEGWLLKKQLQAQYIKDNQLIKSFNQKQLKISKSTSIHYFLNQKQQPLEDKTLRIFSPLLLKLSAIKSISPALGLCFTVISIMMSFQIFASTGDIKAMFQAASVGLGTTAIGACIIVISKLVTDRMVVPLYHDMLDKYQTQVSELTTIVQEAKKVRGHHE
jgi:biopolymer transport protein ExbB/TolQ